MSGVSLFVVAACSDSTTGGGATLVQSALRKGSKAILNNRAVESTALCEIMQFPAIPVFFTGHGNTDACIGSDSRPIFHADQTGWEARSNSVVYSLACFTASSLGQTMSAKHGIIWMGYENAVSAIPKHSRTDGVLIDFLARFMQSVRDYASHRNSQTFMDEFRSNTTIASRALIAQRQFRSAYLAASVALQDWLENLVVHGAAFQQENHEFGRVENMLK